MKFLIPGQLHVLRGHNFIKSDFVLSHAWMIFNNGPTYEIRTQFQRSLVTYLKVVKDTSTLSEVTCKDFIIFYQLTVHVTCFSNFLKKPHINNGISHKIN